MSNTLYSTYVKQDADILDDLIEAYNQGTMSALIGAGFSMNVSKQYKGWGSLLADAYTFVHGEDIEIEYYEYRQRFEEENQNGGDAEFLSKEKYIANKVYADDLLKLVSKYIEKKGYREAIDGYIEQRTPYAVKTKEGKIELHNCNGKVEDINEYSFAVHRQLLNCNRFNNVYTTNYDNLLEFTVQKIPNLKKEKYSYNDAPICRDTDLSNYISHKNIIKIHGSLRMNREAPFGFDNDSNLNYIIAQEDYDTYMQKHEAFAYLMRIAMLSGTFCLIGFSGVDPNYTSWLNWMKDIINKKDDNKPKVFLIDTDPDYKKKENTNESYCKDLYNKNHHVAILHLFDEKVIEKISQKTADVNTLKAKTEDVKTGDEKTKKSKPTISELLFKLLMYIENSEKQASDDKMNEDARKELKGGDDNYITGRNYYYGDGVAKDYDVAFRYLSLSASKEAKGLLAECYLYGRGTETNLSKAIELCKEEYVKVSSSVLYDIAECYYFGTKGVQEDKAEAIEWWKKAAEQEDAKAQFNLGYCYNHGEGVPEDKAEAVEWYTKAAEQGEALAQCNLGYCYQYGEGVPEDKAEAVKCYTKAAEQGLAQAQLNLGYCYQHGEGVPEDKAEAVKWYTKAAEQGLAQAQFNLGNSYLTGDGITEDKAEAVKWYTKAAEQGLAQAQFNLGYCYYNGEGITEDKAEAVKWYTKAAEQGLALAQFNLGNSYLIGDGITIDKAEAVKWYTKAAEQGNADAQFNLGSCYYNGEGIPEDKAEAVKWYTKAAEQGFALAQFNLGYCYQYGESVPEDKAEAVKWYTKAAEQGLAQAQCNLAVCYDKGEGVPEDKAEAVKWYTKAAEQGDAQAQCNLAVCYDKGEGVPEDKAEAVKWYTKAAEQGHAEAQFNLALCYYNGDGVPEDKAEAVKWYKKAAEQGYADAYNGLAWIYQEQGQYEEALPFINKALELSPDDANYIDTLAMIYQGLGRNNEAMEQFEKALKIAEEEKDERLINEIQEHIQALKDQMEK